MTQTNDQDGVAKVFLLYAESLIKADSCILSIHTFLNVPILGQLP